MKILLKKQVHRALLSINLLIVVVLLTFFAQILHNIHTSTKENIEEVSLGISSAIENAFLAIERSAVSISSLEDMEKMLTEKNPLDFHSYANTIKEHLDLIYPADNWVESILIYDNEGRFSRLRGDIGNTAAIRISHLIEAKENYEHIALAPQQEEYIGYTGGIYRGNDRIGYLVFLINAEAFPAFFKDYDISNSLQISLVADDIVVASNDERLNNTVLTSSYTDYSNNTLTQIGLTPYRLAISNTTGIINILDSVIVVTLVTFLVICIILIFGYRFFDKAFFTPMISLLSSTEAVANEYERISPTGQPDFDNLVEQINLMTARVLEKNRQLHETNAKIQTMQIEKQRALMISLKKQINAHFTVNTLNVIKRLSEIDEKEKASRMCEDLSFMLRYANSAEEMISCVQEFIILRKFVDIMLTRYPNKFTVDFDLPDEYYDIFLPKMLLQPLIENAIVHGFIDDKTNHHLQVSVRLSDKNLLFTVSDNGIGMTNQELLSLREAIKDAPTNTFEDNGIERIALENIEKRVYLMFGDGYGLAVESEYHKGSTITLTLPNNF